MEKTVRNTKARRLAKILLGLLAAAAALLLVYHCPFRYIFGVSCPGCGMTRALVAAVFSDLETAFGFHPLFPLLVPAALWIGLRACGLLHMPRKRETAYILAFAGVFILVYLVRLLCGDPVIAPDPQSGLLFRLLRAL